MKDMALRALKTKEGSIFLVLIILEILAVLFVERYTSSSNMRLLFRAIPSLGVLSIGITLLMISGEFDLSVGSTFALGPMISALAVAAGMNIWIAFLFALLTGAFIGLINGLLTVKTAIPSFIVTIGAMLFWRGIVLVISDGRMTEFPLTDGFRACFNSMIGGVTTQFIWFAVLTMILWYLLSLQKFGNWVYATGGNLKAARAMGIRTDTVKIICFIIAGVLAAFAGIFDSTRVEIVNPTQGETIPLTAIAAMVIGGTRLGGGAGSIIGTFIGATIMFTIEDILMLLRVSAYCFDSFVGVVIILAVIGYRLTGKKGSDI